MGKHFQPNSGNQSNEPLDIIIVGGGPTGLAAALFLVDLGHRPRVFEKKAERSAFSKAFGVNSRSLELLEASGVTKRFLANGRKLERLNLVRGTRKLVTLRLDQVDHRFPFMLVQSQADSERILEEALAERGVTVERGFEVMSVKTEADVACIDVVRGGERATFLARHVLVADGARSSIRESLGINFKGQTYSEPWKLYDVELEGPLPADEATIFLLDDGGMFVVRHGDNVWRVLGNAKDTLGRLPNGTRIGKVHWESEFQISNRVVDRFASPPFYLAGDAAHVHAGIGARGMNLGIEDAFVFATLYHAGTLDRYNDVRLPLVKKVVKQISRAMAAPRPKTLPGRLVRKASWVVPFVFALIRQYAQRWILGLDHSIKPLGGRQ